MYIYIYTRVHSFAVICIKTRIATGKTEGKNKLKKHTGCHTSCLDDVPVHHTMERKGTKGSPFYFFYIERRGPQEGCRQQIGHTFQFYLSPGPRGRCGLYRSKKIMNFLYIRAYIKDDHAPFL